MHVLSLSARWACALGAALLLAAAPAAAVSTDLQADHGMYLEPAGAALTLAARGGAPPLLRPENGPKVDPNGVALTLAARGSAPPLLQPENGPQIDPNG